MNTISRTAIAGMLALAFVMYGDRVQAQTQPSPAAVATAKEILVIKQANGIYNGAVTNVINNMKNVLMASNLNYQKDLNELASQLAAEMKSREDELGDAVAKIYASKFTEAELKELLAFYRSPLGKKTIAADPKTVEDTMSYIDGWAQRFSEEVNGRFRGEMRKRGKEI